MDSAIATGSSSRPRSGIDRPNGVLRRAAHHRCAHFRGQPAAELFVERRQRDIPELFGVDKGAIHVEQHRLHVSDSVMGATSVKIVTILVTGATGNIGRRIVDHLIDLGANDIRALTKNPAKAKLPDGVTAVTGYLGDPESLPAALEGVERMYLAPLPKTLEATLELAKQANVEYLVALSGDAHWQAHADAIAASGLVHTQLGPGEFLENFAVWARTLICGRRLVGESATRHGFA